MSKKPSKRKAKVKKPSLTDALNEIETLKRRVKELEDKKVPHPIIPKDPEPRKWPWEENPWDDTKPYPWDNPPSLPAKPIPYYPPYPPRRPPSSVPHWGDLICYLP